MGCEHIDFAENEGKGNENVVQTTDLPQQTGQGTLEAPYTVSDIRNESSMTGQTVWIIGYAVGDAYRSLANATFQPPFQHTSSLLLATSTHCADAAQCLPVELSTTKQKELLSLANNPERHHQCLLVQGTLQTYYGTTGLRSINAYHWLPNYTIPQTEPAEWDEEHNKY